MVDEGIFLGYLDGELDRQTEAAVVDHLRRDPALRRRAAELRAVESAYREIHGEMLPPERRRALLERVRREPAAPGDQLICPADLDWLAEVQSAFAPIFSLYLDLQPERGTAESLPARFEAMLRQAEQQMGADQPSRNYREFWDEEADRLRAWLEMERPLQARTLALFSCLSIGLWQAFWLPAPVDDRLVVADRPFLRPLAALLDELQG